ncbi:TPA: phage tail protein [Vibrio vulnificus]
MAAIVNSGKQYITENLKGNVPSRITRFILANVPHSDPTLSVNPDESMPTAEQIVFDELITRKASITPDEVVFSQIMLSDVGDFDFNWIGLATDDNTLIAVVYTPLQRKQKYEGVQVGNTLTRNIVLKFANAADALDVHIAPETWQFDFTDLIHVEVEKASRAGFLETSSSEIKLGAVNVFLAHALVPLPAPPDGVMFTAKVHSSVDLTAGECGFTPPEGEQIRHKKVLVPKAWFKQTDIEERFIRVNGEWYV